LKTQRHKSFVQKKWAREVTASRRTGGEKKSWGGGGQRGGRFWLRIKHKRAALGALEGKSPHFIGRHKKKGGYLQVKNKGPPWYLLRHQERASRLLIQLAKKKNSKNGSAKTMQKKKKKKKN